VYPTLPFDRGSCISFCNEQSLVAIGSLPLNPRLPQLPRVCRASSSPPKVGLAAVCEVEHADINLRLRSPADANTLLRGLARRPRLADAPTDVDRGVRSIRRVTIAASKCVIRETGSRDPERPPSGYPSIIHDEILTARAESFRSQNRQPSRPAKHLPSDSVGFGTENFSSTAITRRTTWWASRPTSSFARISRNSGSAAGGSEQSGVAEPVGPLGPFGRVFVHRWNYLLAA
jgi:hypothetical protein